MMLEICFIKHFLLLYIYIIIFYYYGGREWTISRKMTGQTEKED